jgi:hypothetical protein
MDSPLAGAKGLYSKKPVHNGGLQGNARKIT